MLACLLLLVPPASAAARPGANGQASLRWAGRQLQQALYPADGSHTGWLYRISDARDSFEGVLAKYGASARAYIGLGKCQQRLGEYQGALRSFERVLSISPASRAAREGAAEARRSLQVARAVAPQLPRREHVLQVGRVEIRPDGALWAVLSAQPSGDRGPFGPEYRSPHLTLFRQSARALQTHGVLATVPPLAETREGGFCPVQSVIAMAGLRNPTPRTAHGGGYRKGWQSGTLDDPRFKNEKMEWDQVALDLFPYAGRRLPEVAVWEQYIGGSWAPCQVEIFQLQGTHLARILSATSDEDFWVRDLRRDQRYEVQNEYCVGLLPSHALQYRWHDIYAYDPTRGGYLVADHAFPRAFQHVTTGLLQVLKKYPGDPQLLEYLGIAQEIRGHPRAALRAYDAAIDVSWGDEESVNAPFSRALLMRREAALRARLTAHRRSARAVGPSRVWVQGSERASSHSRRHRRFRMLTQSAGRRSGRARRQSKPWRWSKGLTTSAIVR